MKVLGWNEVAELGKHRRGSGMAGGPGLERWSDGGFWRTRQGGDCRRNRGLEMTRRGRNCWRNRGLETSRRGRNCGRNRGLEQRGEGGTAGGIAGWNAVGTGELRSKIKRVVRILSKHNERKFKKPIRNSFWMFARRDLPVTTLRLRTSQSRMLVLGGLCRAAGWAAAAADWCWLFIVPQPEFSCWGLEQGATGDPTTQEVWLWRKFHFLGWITLLIPFGGCSLKQHSVKIFPPGKRDETRVPSLPTFVCINHRVLGNRPLTL